MSRTTDEIQTGGAKPRASWPSAGSQAGGLLQLPWYLFGYATAYVIEI
jgi:hypothetical protein